MAKLPSLAQLKSEQKFSKKYPGYPEGYEPLDTQMTEQRDKYGRSQAEIEAQRKKKQEEFFASFTKRREEERQKAIEEKAAATKARQTKSYEEWLAGLKATEAEAAKKAPQKQEKVDTKSMTKANAALDKIVKKLRKQGVTPDLLSRVLTMATMNLMKKPKSAKVSPLSQKISNIKFK